MCECLIEKLLTEDHAIGACMYPKASVDSAEGLIDLYRSHALLPQQTHSMNVAVVEHPCEIFPETDALITFRPNLPIGVLTADCVPVLVYAPDVKAVAAIHAGWKGSLGGIVDNALDMLQSRGASPSEMKVAFGPSISMMNYEVNFDLAERFIAAGFVGNVFMPDSECGKPHIDLQGVNMQRLLNHGVRSENIIPHRGCTFGSERADGTPVYQSHRRSNGNPGRNLTYISLVD